MGFEFGTRGSAVVVAAALGLAMMGTTLPTPLYPAYATTFALAPVLTPVIFATYASGVIAALLYLGYLSDEVGRRRMMLPALAVSALSSAVFLLARGASGLPLLLVGRFLSGLSTGVVSGAGTAWLVDLAGEGDEREEKATRLAVGTNLAGLAAGPLLAGVVAAYTRWPLRLPYVIDLALLLPAIAGVAFAKDERGRDKSFASGRLRRQKLTVAPQARSAFVRAALAGACAFAVAGVINAVAPSFLGKNLHVRSLAASGVLVALFFASGIVGQLTLRKLETRSGLGLGCVALLAGLGALALSLGRSSTPLLFVAAALAGLGQGFVVGAGLADVNGKLGDQRSETDSTYYLVLYLGLSLPVLGVGFLGSATSLVLAGFVFCAVVGSAVAAALIMVAVARGEETKPPPARTFPMKKAATPT